MRRILGALSLAAFLVTLSLVSAAPAAQGPPMGRIYAHDELYTVVITPRDLPNEGRFDAIYVLGPDLMPVSEAAPGDPAYNGGRWEVRIVSFVGMSPTQFTNADQITAAAAMGKVTVSDVVRRFECPLIPLNGR
ncbi:MAG: hypothetical protein AABZ94_09065 [Candidatus Eisenbacteria bacterium]